MVLALVKWLLPSMTDLIQAFVLCLSAFFILFYFPTLFKLFSEILKCWKAFWRKILSLPRWLYAVILFFPFCKKKKKVCNVCNFIAAVPWCWFCVLVCSFFLTLTHVHTHTHTAIFLRNLFILLHSAGSVKHLKGEHLCKDGSTIKECVCECA